MRIVIASDTHMQHDALPVPVGDVFVHCGDFSKRGTPEEVGRFGTWLGALPHRRKIVVAGNHDFTMQTHPDDGRSLLGNADYLCDTGIVIDGTRFYGSPWQPIFMNWAFNLEPRRLREKWSLIPDETDVLVTHGPPYAILDLNVARVNCGDADLADRVLHVRPALHAFGHIHESSGSLERNGTLFVNAAVLDARYRLANRCRVVDLTRTSAGAVTVTELAYT